MKKALSIILVALMLFVLVACDNGTSTNTPATSSPAPSDSSAPTSSAPPTTSSAPPSSSAPAEPSTPPDNTATGEIGMYNPDYDYGANDRYKIVYLVSNNTSGLYTETGKSFEHWASLSNVDYQGLLDFGGDIDAFFSQLPQLARDYDGLVMDADSNVYDRVAEVLEPTGTPWMSFMAAPRDYTLDAAPLTHPYIGFEQYDVGAFHAEYLINKAKETWPDVDLSEFGFITVDYSAAPPLHEREVGAYDKVMEIAPEFINEGRYFVADTATLGLFTADISQQVVNSVLSMNPQITRWLVFGEIDDMAQGAAAALDLMGYNDDSWVTAFGGTALQQQWDTGRQSAWKSANYLPQSIFTEPIYFTLYAFMNGDATPETIFPEWKNKNEDTTHGSFATRLLPYYEILFDNYKHVLKWSDLYANSNIFPNYPTEGITRDDFSVTLPVPAFYK